MTVEARIWPWRSGKSLSNVFKLCHLCSEAAVEPGYVLQSIGLDTADTAHVETFLSVQLGQCDRTGGLFSVGPTLFMIQFLSF